MKPFNGFCNEKESISNKLWGAVTKPVKVDIPIVMGGDTGIGAGSSYKMKLEYPVSID
jgi:hypothetical protein